MINFKKRLDLNKNEKKLNPIEIYEYLDRASDKGPLRPAQKSILQNWFEKHREQKDVIIKLHTGQGKTLIGLLILQSRLNSGGGPVVYVCPNIYLAKQTQEQAKQFGLKTCEIDRNNDLPNEFWESEAILITHVQKVFNGRTIFGLNNSSVQLDSIVLDDSHACIDSIDDSSTIKIPRESEIYDKVLSLFEDYLSEQGYANFMEIKEGSLEQVMNVPYWAWNDQFKEITNLLIENSSENFIYFSWPLIKDNLENCNCFISGSSIEISPSSTPIHSFGSFNKASNRILMSATTNNDAFFIKGLGISANTIKNPLTYLNEKWSGEKMILIPYQISDYFNRVNIVNWLAQKMDNRPVGFAVLTPSFKDADYWESCGALKINSSDISKNIQDLKNGKFDEVFVFSNRYDGIDLPDDSCRVLIFDSKPYAQTLKDKYEENVREGSELIDIKVAQKIEQGLGRAVRGEKDYCVIILTGRSLLSTIKNKRFKNFFSSQTQQQIKIGSDITKFAVEDSDLSNPIKTISDIINLSLKRDDDWKSYYNQKMNEIVIDTKKQEMLSILELEKNAEIQYSQGNFEKARKLFQKIINDHDLSENEIGWYFQEIARVIYKQKKSESNKVQIAAHKLNRYLLKPSSGMSFQKLIYNEKRSEKVKKWIEQFEDFSELKFRLDEILSMLVFGPHAKKFENSLEQVGLLLGFPSERPEVIWKGTGPDNLWCLGVNDYFVIECKSGVNENRAEILQSESEQLLNSGRWFEENYIQTDYTPLLIINTNLVAKGAYLPTDGKIMKKGKLNKLKTNIRRFFNEFEQSDLQELSIKEIHELLKLHDLSISDLKTKYFVDPKYQKKY